MKKLISQGKCVYCEAMIPQNEMTRHLAGHLKQMETQSKLLKASAFHLKVETDLFFMHLLAHHNCTFKMLDDFLRKIWLECCGHSSGFSHQRTTISKSRKMEEVLSPRMKLQYMYDYGDTTILDITVHSEYSWQVTKNIMLLARNEPLEYLCDHCHKKLAVEICPVHFYEGGDAMFCEKCMVEHEKECDDFSEEMRLPVVNSPRMGICGYEGGVIDTDRDRIKVRN